MFLLANNAFSTLAAAVNAGDLAFTIQAADAAKFPNPAAGQKFALVVVRKNTGEKEIMICTARAGAVFTVTRAQEGTAALSFVAGDIVSLRLTALQFRSTVYQVGAGGAPAFENLWTQLTWPGDPPFPQRLSYRATIDGFVDLFGGCERGAGNSSATVFTLPVGFRPTMRQTVLASGWNGAATVLVPVTINTDGTVVPGVAVSQLSFASRFAI